MELQENLTMKLFKFHDEEHPLKFVSEGTKGNTSDDEEISRVCRGCALPIFSGSPLYTCEECDHFSLHKTCAELPMELGHHHDDHEFSPTFDRELPFLSCHSCRNLAEHKFFYWCNVCSVILDIICLSSDHSPEINTIKHRGHPRHPLELLGRPALLLCDACGEEHRGHFYMCNSCRFYIHQDCASFPRTIKRSEYHAHSLTLSYTNPSGHDSSEDVCVICRKSCKARFWMYWCSRCRRAMHLKCAMSKIEPFMSILLPRVIGHKSDTQIADRNDVIRLPPANEFVSVVGHLTTSTNFGNVVDSKEVKILMGCEHTLDFLDNESSSSIIESFLFGPGRDYFSNVPQCDVCFRAVSPPFYCCKICNLFFHQMCSKLPSEIQHPWHRLILRFLRRWDRHRDEFFGIFTCDVCGKKSNGICYVCQGCRGCVDVKCALLPRNIIHEAHPYHVLVLDKKEPSEGSINCCRFSSFSWFPMLDELGCYTCNTCDFGMDAGCSLYPSTARHPYDEHELKLIYDPSQANSDEYYCEICELQIDQRKWFYHCVECDLSFHIWCNPSENHQSFRITAIPSTGYYQNLKFGGTGNFKIHPHTLIFVHHLEGSSCNSCDVRINGLAFECSECNYVIHFECCRQKEV